MKDITKEILKKVVVPGKQRSYNEIIEFFDAHWIPTDLKTPLETIYKLDQTFDKVSQKLKTVLVTGTNGKSLTINFASKLFKEEAITVGTLTTPHVLTYNERISVNDTPISNKVLVELANEVINAAQTHELHPNTYDILTMIALLYFAMQKVDVALLEVDTLRGWRAPQICTPTITAITRINDSQVHNKVALEQALTLISKGTYVISADQNKAHLQIMSTCAQDMGGVWAMPIRKLSPLAYPYEQLHGRCAALAERIASIFVNDVLEKPVDPDAQTLLTKQKGQRGRPTLEAKRQSELHPQRTIEQFWKERGSSLGGKFQILDKEKPTILLDSADNLDAFENLLLGIRLLHYQRPLKGLTLILGNNNPDLDMQEFMKALRYFFKKTSGQVIVCPVSTIPGERGTTSWEAEKVTNDIKSMKIKARSAKNFEEAFELACKSVDERYGLVVITGCTSILSEYWKSKGIKKI
jgi:folylpolyglutamate synthase/dihydropteroate synthase